MKLVANVFFIHAYDIKCTQPHTSLIQV